MPTSARVEKEGCGECVRSDGEGGGRAMPALQRRVSSGLVAPCPPLVASRAAGTSARRRPARQWTAFEG